MIEKQTYMESLGRLSQTMKAVGNTPFSIFAKVVSLTSMNMRYEKIAFNMDLPDHPYVLTNRIIQDALVQFESMMDMAFIESEDKRIDRIKSRRLEEKHEALWQEIWSRHSEEEFDEFVEWKTRRLDINNLGQFIENSNCVDFGCGNGSFSFALLKNGAKSVTGVDFGEKSIMYAKMMAKKKKLEHRFVFNMAQVYDTELSDTSFDFAVSNGVFHHLSEKNIVKAVKEVARVLKKGGWFWYYIDGKNAISMDLWDMSVDILKDVDVLYIEKVLNAMNVKRNKIVHLMDGLSATYRHSTWDEMTAMLSEHGFGNFRRISGGTDTDLDPDRIAMDQFGKEKFGEGDLRVLCQRIA